MASENIPHLDLDNFDNAAFDGSKFILTSPRSLKACASVGIKPIEILPIDFDSFKSSHPNLHIAKIKKLFADADASRADKLRRARDERLRIMESEGSPPQQQRAKSLQNARQQFGVSGRALFETTPIKTFEQKEIPPPVKTTRPSRYSNVRTRESIKKTNSKPNAVVTLSRPGSSFSRTSTPQQMIKALNYSLGSLERNPSNVHHESIAQMNADYRRPRHQTLSRTSNNSSFGGGGGVGVGRAHSASYSGETDAASRRANVIEQHRRELRLLEEKYKRDKDEQKLFEEKEKDLHEKDEKHRRLFLQEKKKLADKLASQRIAMNEKRLKLNDNLRQQEGQMERYCMDLMAHTEENLRRAERDKLRQEMIDQERRKIENHLKEMEFHERKIQLDSQDLMLKQDLRQSLQERDQRVEKNQTNLQKEKHFAIKNSQLQRQKKVRQSAERRKILDQEVKHYQEELQAYRDALLAKAEIHVQEKLNHEQRRVHQERVIREEIRRNNYEHIKTLEDEWKEDAEAVIRQKDAKSQKVSEEMKSRIEESRALALAAEQLREDIRRAYNLDSFDKKVQQANFVGQMGL